MSRTKKLLSLMLAVLLAAIIMVMPVAQVVAKAQSESGENTGSDGTGKYISEVRVGLGKSVSAAAAALEGYTIVTDDKGNYADLNEGAESNSIIGSKGSKVVLLGFKTTNDPKKAITDLAVMNMDGGYSVKDYEALMDKYIDTQIKPFIESFSAAIQEYRENYNSANPGNKKRAQFAHDALNKLYDDDTESCLGDLLLNETAWELGDEAYNKLSDAEKKQHADLVTILCQANGQATLTMQNLLTRASDTADDTWVDRFINADAYAIMDQLFPEMTQTDAEAMMATIFGDDAQKILGMWSSLLSDLNKYDEAVEYIENFAQTGFDEETSTIEDNYSKDMSAGELAEVMTAEFELNAKQTEAADYMNIVAMHDFLESVEYFDGFTLLDYFTQPKADAASDMMTLYALVSSLSPGQRAGLVNISLQDLINMAMTDSQQYDTATLKELEPASVYEGVDRAIYEKGAVALTSEALRKQASVNDTSYDPFSTLSKVMLGVSAASIIATIGSWAAFGVLSSKASTALKAAESFSNLNLDKAQATVAADLSIVIKQYDISMPSEVFGEYEKMTLSNLQIQYGMTAEQASKVTQARGLYEKADQLAQKSSTARAFSTGLTVLTVALTAYTVYMTYNELCDYYDTEFSPIPNYIVDEADITAKNAKGETFVLKNQTAYYKAVLCNRTKSDEKYKEIGDKADLNGDVGRKWVALYTNKNEAQCPILADSFKVVYGTSNVPLEYSRGIHKFGSGAAFDMNNTYYAWNHGKGGIYVYFKTDDVPASRANAVGTVQTAGAIAGAAIGGLFVGLLAGSLIMNKRKKKKEEADTAA